MTSWNFINEICRYKSSLGLIRKGAVSISFVVLLTAAGCTESQQPKASDQTSSQKKTALFISMGDEGKSVHENYERMLPHRQMFQICGGHEGPVIKKGDSGTEGNLFGIEGGRVFRYKGEYHLFTAEEIGPPKWVKMRLAHWKSPDGIKWQRLSTLYESSGDFTGRDPRAALWGPMPTYDEKEDRWNLFYVTYRCKPNDETGWYINYNGNIWRAVSTVPGYDGLGGPYEDVGVILKPGPDSDPWEGLQGTDSFFAYPVGDQWYGFYGSAQTQAKINPEYSKWSVGLAKAPSLAGPWKRCSEMNPVVFSPRFAENPVITKLENGPYVAFIDGASQFAYSVSDDGVHWSKAVFVDLGTYFKKWWHHVRTPLGLIPEPDGTFTVFYTAATGENGDEYDCMGMVKFKRIDLK